MRHQLCNSPRPLFASELWWKHRLFESRPSWVEATEPHQSRRSHFLVWKGKAISNQTKSGPHLSIFQKVISGRLFHAWFGLDTHSHLKWKFSKRRNWSPALLPCKMSVSWKRQKHSEGLTKMLGWHFAHPTCAQKLHSFSHKCALIVKHVSEGKDMMSRNFSEFSHLSRQINLLSEQRLPKECL